MYSQLKQGVFDHCKAQAHTEVSVSVQTARRTRRVSNEKQQGQPAGESVSASVTPPDSPLWAWLVAYARKFGGAKGAAPPKLGCSRAVWLNHLVCWVGVFLTLLAVSGANQVSLPRERTFARLVRGTQHPFPTKIASPVLPTPYPHPLPKLLALSRRPAITPRTTLSLLAHCPHTNTNGHPPQLASDLSEDTHIILVGSFGALMTLLYSAPASPLVQPRNVFFGNMVRSALSAALTPHTPTQAFQSQQHAMAAWPPHGPAGGTFSAHASTIHPFEKVVPPPCVCATLSSLLPSRFSSSTSHLPRTPASYQNGLLSRLLLPHPSPRCKFAASPTLLLELPPSSSSVVEAKLQIWDGCTLSHHC